MINIQDYSSIVKLIIIILLLVLVYYLIFEKSNKENFDSTVSNEAIQTISSVYNKDNLLLTNLNATGNITASNDVKANNIYATNNLNGKTLNISDTLTSKNINASKLIVSGDLTFNANNSDVNLADAYTTLMNKLSKIQYGANVNVSTGTTTTVTFPKAYNSVPSVICTFVNPSANKAPTIYITGLTNSKFTITTNDYNAHHVDGKFNWIAIGD